MINQRCALYGHRLNRPKYFGDKGEFYVRHCINCEYITAGEIVIDAQNHRITVDKQSYKRNYDKPTDITSTPDE